jgi:predicted dehydrogenase
MDDKFGLSTQLVLPYRVIVIGCGKRGVKYINALKSIPGVNICAIIDSNQSKLDLLANQNNIPCFLSFDKALSEIDIDIAIVSVPHSEHFEITKLLLEKRIHVIKEKPLGLNYDEASFLINLAKEKSVKLFTVVQRNFREPYIYLKNKLNLIGSPYSFNYRYYKNFSTPPEGWRASQSLAGGGVMIDMGFHLSDIIIRLFGMPTNCASQASFCFPGMQKEHLEDSINVLLGYSPQNLQGVLSLARDHYNEIEELEILGNQGELYLTPRCLNIYNLDNQLVDGWHSEETDITDTRKMLLWFLNNIANETYFEKESQIQLSNTLLIDKIYQSFQPIYS